jgi:tetratricopeptide (TPR) repeat protein
MFCLMGFGGDFALIYRRETASISVPLLACHVLTVLLLWRERGRPRGKRFRLHANLLWDRIRFAERESLAHPAAPQPELALAAAYLRAELPDDAAEHAELALKLSPASSVAKLLTGLSIQGPQANRAESLLQSALDDPELEESLAQAGRLGLARVRLAGGNAEGALGPALAALKVNPKDGAAAELVAAAARRGHAEAAVLAALELAARENLTARSELEALERSLRRRPASG